NWTKIERRLIATAATAATNKIWGHYTILEAVETTNIGQIFTNIKGPSRILLYERLGTNSLGT
ncbi:hypothetical protein ACJX0J_036876, partial [Zea mays]